jgi:YfiH family protein
MNLIRPDWPAPKNIHALTTTRHTWGSLTTSSQEASERSKLVTTLGLPSEPLWLKQTHSIIALPATETINDQEADASFTQQPGKICMVLTADCLPVLICNRQGTQVAAIHAGWRGLAAGVIESTVKAMQLVTTDALVWLGPAIGPDKFEVGDDVYQAFIAHDATAADAFKPGNPGKWLANLYLLATRRLNKLGIEGVYGGNYCTHSQSDLFFSWRRDQNKTARLASLIWIDSK